ncbi:MAG: hypothetical protein O7C59_11190 [Rickettsia endosymbiont of Ixodes persulcatus]|nr:hypothetical protein [Rickettsia endosymbiont of Ixodes persulcatus]MCZ6903158.1 hypothetical protein [Rickettsia endosymbiont of Ixodes persulcatus]MCZ6909223.1 hypothetical protein [Rickettsia endosymbiont of Ixodes persulcatus]MCZ6914930.1 hypothetical protein [Rickettsia endosymbiont of Ixodes persulcatus]
MDSRKVLDVIPWLDHGIQKIIKKDWIPRLDRGMTLEITGFLRKQE